MTLLERKCIENGIQYKKVNPAFTSIIGKYKYRWMHKTNIHESAAFVIGRRGLGYNEKLSFYKLPHERVKAFVLGTLAEKYRNKRVHSWRLWKALNDNVEAVLTGLQVRLADLKEFVGNIWYRGEKFLERRRKWLLTRRRGISGSIIRSMSRRCASSLRNNLWAS